MGSDLHWSWQRWIRFTWIDDYLGVLANKPWFARVTWFRPPARLTVGDLYEAKAIQEADPDAAIDASMLDTTTDRLKIGEGYTIDRHAAVAVNPVACATMAQADASEYLKRTFVRFAILCRSR